MNRARKTTYFFFAVMMISTALYCLSYIKESAERSLILSKLTFRERQLYIEKTYKYQPVYQYAECLDSHLPKGSTFSLYGPKINYMYYYSRLNYFLWPKYIKADVKVVARINDGDSSAIHDLKYGDVIFTPSLRTDIKSIKINGVKYYVEVRSGNASLLKRVGK